MSSDLYNRTLYSPNHKIIATELHHQSIGDTELQTLNRIAELEEKWRLDCQRLTLWQRPIKTLAVFAAAVASFSSKLVLHLISHSIFQWIVLPLVILWIVAELVPGPHINILNSIDFVVEYVVWWVGLGILSSIGLGSGLQTGVLFLFPHIIKVCLTAEACGTTNFESFSSIWFRESDKLFRCPTDEIVSSTATYFGIWKLIIIPR